MLTFLILAVVMILIMYKILKEQKKQAGIKGWVMDQDLDGSGKKIYRNNKAGISGKPDIVEHNRIVEHKSATAAGRPRYSDILQLAAQLLATGKKTAELAYGNGQSFTFDANGRTMKKAMKRVSVISGLMRWHLITRIPPSGTPATKKCNVCMFKRECPDVQS